MTKPRDMCWECWYVWKDIIESALRNFGVFAGEYKDSDLGFLHCHHERKENKK
jgi:hypothetical protein